MNSEEADNAVGEVLRSFSGCFKGPVCRNIANKQTSTRSITQDTAATNITA